MRVSAGVSSAHLPDCDGSVAAAVGVVDDCVERLIDPLPEQDSRSGSASQPTGKQSSARTRRTEQDKTLFNLLQ